jgi:hypothetical protein
MPAAYLEKLNSAQRRAVEHGVRENACAPAVPLLVIAGAGSGKKAIEPTLHITGADRIDWRIDGGRDVVTFTAHPDSIEMLIADALRAAGLVHDEETRKRTLIELFKLSGEAVLALTRAKPGLSLAEPRIAKGTIGVLTAVRWYTKHHPDALVISLDDPTSRQWILGVGSDDRHGDLLVVREEPDGVLIEVLEVKAHDSETAGIRYDDRRPACRPDRSNDRSAAENSGDSASITRAARAARHSA